jgi:pimeloyl-ACP methyl ester carboxylesterase
MYFSGRTAMQMNTSDGTATMSVPSARGIAVHEIPVVRDVGRFREKPGLRFVRRLFKVLSVTAPSVATRLGYRLLATPPRFAERPWQAQLRQSARTSNILVGRRNVRVYEWGTGPTVLMVHGWGARATHMGRMIEPLVAAGYRVVSFDAPAHGDSQGRQTDLVEFANAVNAVANFSGQVDTLIAHSFGAAMALLAQRDWGMSVKKQVLVSTFDSCQWFIDEFAKYIGVSRAVVRAMQEKMAAPYGGWFDWNRVSLGDMLAISKVPTLLIHDTTDGEIPFQHSATLMLAGPHMSIYVTHDLGHHRVLGAADVHKRVVEFAGGGVPEGDLRS